MSNVNRNIDVYEADVIKDMGGTYPSGCTQYLQCAAEYVGEERIAIDISDTNCTITANIGDVLPLSGSAIPNVLTVKLNDPQRGYIWVDKTSYDANHPDCNDCCVALPTLTTPSGFTASNGNTQSVINWNDVTSATSYTLERSLSNSFTSPVTVYTGSVSGYTNTGLTNGTTYYYRVKATAPGYTESEYAFTSATPAP